MDAAVSKQSGGITLAIYIAIAITGAAFGQQQEPLPGQPLYKAPPPAGTPVKTEPVRTVAPLDLLSTQSAPRTTEIMTQQSSTHVKTLVVRPPDGWTPPDRRHVNLLPSQEPPEPVVMYREPGGSIP
jgi:hypothetical protein